MKALLIISRAPKEWWNGSSPEVWDVLEEVIKEHPVLLKPCAYPAQAGYPGF
jgi:DNA-directed RNA polymerase beta' subunit